MKKRTEIRIDGEWHPIDMIKIVRAYKSFAVPAEGGLDDSISMCCEQYGDGVVVFYHNVNSQFRIVIKSILGESGPKGVIRFERRDNQL